ncbi:MAG: hypothetical protein L0H39_11950, partial [Brachybacterium sp.]|nr:hypothetical protein [Brachybacterium sp.]
MTTLDSADGAVLGTAEPEGCVRLDPASDGRHAADAITMYGTGAGSPTGRRPRGPRPLSRPVSAHRPRIRLPRAHLDRG